MSARQQVTITLGRTGQVVKRAGPVSDPRHFNYEPSSGTKRPIRERLGNNVDDDSYSGLPNNKRQRRDGHNTNHEERFQSQHRIRRDDLRYKLMNKGLLKKSTTSRNEKDHLDLRQKLSRNTQIPSRYETQHRIDSRPSGFVRRIAPARSADDLLHLESSQKSYSPWTLDGTRHRSPDRLIGASRGISPSRNFDDLRHVSSVRSLDPLRRTPYATNSFIDASKPTAFMSKPSVAAEAGKSMVRGPPPGGIVQKAAYAPEEPLTVPGLLHSLGLGKYAILFQAEEVDMAALKQMGDHDLKELGIPMGPRKKILLAVLSRSKQRRN